MGLVLRDHERFSLADDSGPKRDIDPVRIENLCISYETPAGLVPAVRSVSLSVAQGKTLGLVGESGSGKSTVGMAILDYLPRGTRKTASRMEIVGINLSQRPKSDFHRLRGGKISAVYQNPGAALNPSMRIGKQIAEILEFHKGLSRKDANSEVERLLEEVHIRRASDVMRQLPHEISGGMQQRVCIAMAMALEPDLIVLDEPTTALDVTVQRQIMDLLVDLQRRRGTSYLLISHDIELVGTYAHQVAVMRAGEIVETGSYDQLRTAPKHSYTKQLLESARGQSTQPNHFVSANPVLNVQGLQHRFSTSKSGDPVIRGITLQVEKGETLGLIGESGSGKSTIGKLICGIHDIQNGAIKSGKFLLPNIGAKRTRRDRNDIRMVFQSPDLTLNPAKNIRSILCRAAEIAGEPVPAARAEELLDQVGLSHSLLSRRPSELSGGQKQRVAIARAFASRPKLVVLDEPTSALDATAQTEILNLLRELQEKARVGYLLITHDLSVVAQLAHRVSVICNGEIVEHGDAQQILADPQHEYTKRLISSKIR